MKIGMNLLLWTDKPQRAHIPLLSQIKRWGFDGAEFPLDDMEPEDVRLFAEELHRTGLCATGIVAMPAQKANPVSPNPVLRDAAVSYMKACIDKAAVLGAHVIGGPLFEGLGYFTGGGPTAQEIEWCVDTYQKIIPYAQERGITLAGEPINRFETYFVNTVGQGLAIAKRLDSPYFGLHVDTCHGNIEETSIIKAWKDAGNYIKHVHISENTRGVPGTGSAITQGLFEVLYEIGYDGWLTIEAFDTSVPPLASRLHIWRDFAPSKEEIAKKGIAFIRASLEKAGKKAAE